MATDSLRASLSRIRALTRARLQLTLAGGAPVSALLTHAGIAALGLGLVRGALPPYAYALASLCLSAALIALPLCGELGSLLRTDPAREWTASLPARASEQRAAQSAQLLLALGVLALASLVPAALLAPASFGPLARLGLLGAGLAQALALAALLLALQSAFAGRAEGVLVLVQLALVGLIALGLLLGPRHVHLLRELHGPESLGWLRALPSAWCALPFAAKASALHALAPLAAAAAALALIALLPEARARAARRANAFERALEPVRRAFARACVRADERGAFDLVYDALPREREFVLRTYPLLGLPLALLAVGLYGEQGARREGPLALLLFSAGVYLPVLLVQVPCSSSHAARWLLDSAPVGAGALRCGALKALALRFVLPLYALLGALAAALAGQAFALRMTPAACATALLVLFTLGPLCMRDPPLSLPHEEARAEFDWAGALMGLGLLQALLAVLAWRYLQTAWSAALAAALLAAALPFAARRARRAEPH